MVSKTSGGFALLSNGDRTMGFEGQEHKTYTVASSLHSESKGFAYRSQVQLT